MVASGLLITSSTTKNSSVSSSSLAEQSSELQLNVSTFFHYIAILGTIVFLLTIDILSSPIYSLDSGFGSDFAMDEDDDDTY